jgi:acetyl esterase/lipase
MGTSAGGNLAAVAAHQVVDKGMTPSLTGVVLMAPNLLHFKAVPEEWREYYRSFEEHKDALILDRKGIEFFDGGCPSNLRVLG